MNILDLSKRKKQLRVELQNCKTIWLKSNNGSWMHRSCKLTTPNKLRSKLSTPRIQTGKMVLIY
jgi:hypothetical protein